jgi:ABC-2 type transport system permease protein
MSASTPSRQHPSSLADELAKLPAFFRRDFLIAWSYRASFLTDLIALLTQAGLFAVVGLMVDPQSIPNYGGVRATYVEFVAIGLSVGVFLSIGLTRVMSALALEQVQGTLESLILTPTSFATIQLGSAAYDLVYVPIRTAVFLAIIALTFDAHFATDGILPAAFLLLMFIPVVWGLGVASAAIALTYRGGTGAVGLGATVITIGSGAYVPLELLPGWVQTLADANPLAIVLEGMRGALLGGTGWAGIPGDLIRLVPMAGASLALGAWAFRMALARERRKGTLGLY